MCWIFKNTSSNWKLAQNIYTLRVYCYCSEHPYSRMAKKKTELMRTCSLARSWLSLADSRGHESLMHRLHSLVLQPLSILLLYTYTYRGWGPWLLGARGGRPARPPPGPGLARLQPMANEPNNQKIAPRSHGLGWAANQTHPVRTIFCLYFCF
jgi:hypothetical protein